MALTISLKGQRNSDDEDLVLFPEAASQPDSAPDSSLTNEQGEGQLAVDVSESPKEIVIRSTIAGVKPEDLEVSVHNDMLTIRGSRHAHTDETGTRYLVRECHWGSFSRSLILPAEIDADKISAELKNGILTIRLPKVERLKKINIR